MHYDNYNLHCVISIHALLAESDSAFDVLAVSALLISIHALLAESDPPVREIIQWEGIFLSTLSLRRATASWSARLAPRVNFYPRSPCGERLPCVRLFNGKAYFYPRSPCGERRGSVAGNWQPAIFLSTLSLRRATGNSVASNFKHTFLSTLSLRRATFIWVDKTQSAPNFYPRSPCGERPNQSEHYER